MYSRLAPTAAVRSNGVAAPSRHPAWRHRRLGSAERSEQIEIRSALHRPANQALVITSDGLENRGALGFAAACDDEKTASPSKRPWSPPRSDLLEVWSWIRPVPACLPRIRLVKYFGCSHTIRDRTAISRWSNATSGSTSKCIERWSTGGHYAWFTLLHACDR